MFQEVLGKEVFTESVGAAVAEGYSLTSLSLQIVFSKNHFQNIINSKMHSAALCLKANLKYSSVGTLCSLASSSTQKRP